MLLLQTSLGVLNALGTFGIKSKTLNTFPLRHGGFFF